MSKFSHPTELNLLQRFLQARTAFRSTSRAFNDSWYRDALDLDLQWHLKVDGGPVRSWIHHLAENRWEEGPGVPEAALLQEEQTAAFIEELFTSVVPKKSSGFGVVLHVADEIAITEIQPEHDDPSQLSELRQQVITEPRSVIADSSLPPEEQSWRLIPFPTPGTTPFATAVTLSRRYDAFLAALRSAGEERNVPVQTSALSAPLTMLQALPFLYEGELGKPLVGVFHYPAFTAMAFFTAEGNLVLLRTLQHRRLDSTTQVRHAAATTAAALELADPDVLVFSLTGEGADRVIRDLREVFPEQSVRPVDWTGTAFSPETTGLPSPEPAVALADTSEAGTPLSNSLTFSAFRDEAWARQDFLPPAPTVVERFPNRNEMRLLRFARLGHLGFAAVTLLIIAWMVFSIIGVVRRPEWAFDPAESKALKQRTLGLGVEQERIHHWDNLLEDRSKGWASMELICRLFPPGKGVLLTKVGHTVKPDSAPGQAKVGFVKTWKVSGFARDGGYRRLTELNTQEGISAAFNKIAAITGHEAFEADLPSRTLVVNLRTVENSRFSPRPVEELIDADETSYPLSFDFTITQRFESTDPMALMITKAPKL